MPNIILHQPEQPGNAGTIGRTCVCAGASLHLIEPIGFHLTDRYIKRAGLDYWNRLDVHRHMNYETFLEEHPDARIWYVTTKAKQTYADVTYSEDDYLMFGKESGGIPEEILVQHPERCIRIPMMEGERSLNLSNSVSIVLYEALRQLHFPNLVREGHLHHLEESPS
ncbi:MAG: tRNA (cytidine(34)-2'-O)-methyltransferase [Lachnospiraceae bacterium]|nr:tRNA (cytidine(34)-2'-O)-methyltransferase [Lachnospiraceae bacterium]